MTSNYVDWGISEGIRELLQNSIDAETKGFLSQIHYDPGKRLLEITSIGASLPLETLLIGYTTKRGDVEAVGQFGEGFKLGCMSLLKAGLYVEILNQDQLWRPAIRESVNFPGQEVLVFDIFSEDDDCSELLFDDFRSNGLTFYVRGLDDISWQTNRKNFLMFEPRHKYLSFETPFGEVIEMADRAKKDEFTGKIYVNGILVEAITDEVFNFGYNFSPGHISVDRDRRMVDRHKLKGVIGKMWNYLAVKDEHFSMFETMLVNNSADVSDFRYSWTATADLKKKIYASFIRNYGENAFAVTTSEEAERAKYMGKNPIIAGQAFLSTVGDELGSLSALEDEYKTKISDFIEIDEIDKDKSMVLHQAWQILSSAIGLHMPPIEVCRFAKDSMAGLYVKKGGESKIYISEDVLDDLGETLRVLIHEYAHQWGDHHSPGFLDKIEESWKKLYMKAFSRYGKLGGK